MQKLLKPAERAQETADESSQKYAHKNQRARDIVGKLEFR